MKRLSRTFRANYGGPGGFISAVGDGDSVEVLVAPACAGDSDMVAVTCWDGVGDGASVGESGFLEDAI